VTEAVRRWLAPNAEVNACLDWTCRSLKRKRKELVSQALSMCELKVAKGAAPPSPREAALCAAALSLKETLNTFVALLKAG